MMIEMGFLIIGGLFNVFNGCFKYVRFVLDSVFLVMVMVNGFSLVIMNLCDLELMKIVKFCDIINGVFLYVDFFLELNEGGFVF